MVARLFPELFFDTLQHCFLRENMLVSVRYGKYLPYPRISKDGW